MSAGPGTTVGLDQLADAFEDVFAAQRRLRGRDAIDADGVSFAQLRLLRALVRDGPMPATRLAEAVAITPSTATQMVEALERRKLVRRTHSKTDRRVVTVDVTEDGRRRSEARRSANRAVFARMFAEVPSNELATGVEILRRYADYLDSL